MRTEEISLNEEVVYTPMRILGGKLRVVEIAPEVNLVRLADGKDFNIWVHPSEIEHKFN
ncbi:MAG: hypothetical protein INR69_08235 [Mucilaginibacter polytrichastri]|nr:hypothetical protein [Mucilaginibacter polytrichastri]